MTRPKAAKTPAPESAGSAEHLASFEGTLERLHAIVEQLEGGELPLEDSLRLFEEGVRLSRASQARLNAAEKRVEELLAVDANGEPITRELDENQ